MGVDVSCLKVSVDIDVDRINMAGMTALHQVAELRSKSEGDRWWRDEENEDQIEGSRRRKHNTIFFTVIYRVTHFKFVFALFYSNFVNKLQFIISLKH